jgi:hypothetical protein
MCAEFEHEVETELEVLELEVIDLGRLVLRLEWAWKKVVGVT